MIGIIQLVLKSLNIHRANVKYKRQTLLGLFVFFFANNFIDLDILSISAVRSFKTSVNKKSQKTCTDCLNEVTLPLCFLICKIKMMLFYRLQ